TGSAVMVGRNGFIWVNGGNETVAVESIRRIETYAHAENLTHDIQCFLAAKTGSGMPHTEGPSNEDAFGGPFSSDRGSRFNDRGGRGGGFNSRPRGDFRGRPDSRGFAPRNNFRSNDRGFPPRDGFRNDRGDRGASRGSFAPRPEGMNRGDRGDRGDRSGFAPRPRFSNNRPRPDNFRMNPRFGAQFDAPDRSVERKKRFPRDDTRIRGDEDPSFE
ncbi:MAG: hypothetical protein AABY11_03215, partial [archaeon]